MSLFIDKAPRIMASLLADFPVLDVESAAAILGNLGHESGGFKLLQEQKPTVPGSRGGYGWPQWTGPRRKAYEAYCARNKLDPASDKANYAYLFVELTSSEKKAIPAVHKATGLNGKVIAFEKAFLRAGIKHYASRQRYAAEALAAWLKARKPVRGITAADMLDHDQPVFVPAEPKPPPPIPPQPGDGLGEPEISQPLSSGFFVRLLRWLGFGWLGI